MLFKGMFSKIYMRQVPVIMADSQLVLSLLAEEAGVFRKNYRSLALRNLKL